MRRISLLAVAALLFAQPAAADEEKKETRTRWYGWQTLAVDAAGVGLSFATRVQSPYIIATLAGAPLVHFLHGHQVKALVDFGLRVVIPLGSALAVAGPFDPNANEGDAKYNRFVVTGVIAAAVVSAFDAVVLGREEVEIPRETTGIHVSPTGVAGRF